MGLYDLIGNDKFFSPLCSVNQELYFECISYINKKVREHDEIFEEDIKNYIREVLEKNSYKEEDEDNNDVLQDHLRIFNRFKECGWLTEREITGDLKYCIDVTPFCRKLISFLNNQLYGDQTVYMSNNLISMTEILNNIEIRINRPYSQIIVPIVDAKNRLENDIEELDHQISKFIEILKSANTVNQVYSSLNEEHFNKFIYDYEFLKNSGSFMQYIRTINVELIRFKKNDLFQKAIDEYININRCKTIEAQIVLEDQIDEVIYFLKNKFVKKFEEIDVKIKKFYSINNKKLRTLVMVNEGLQEKLAKIINVLGTVDNKNLDEVYQVLQDGMMIHEQKYISIKSLKINKNIKKVYEPKPIHKTNVDQELEINKMRIKNPINNRFGVNSTNNYFDELFKKQGINSFDITQTNCKEEALMYHSAIHHMKKRDFDYVVECRKGNVQFELGQTSEIIVRRKK